MLASSAGGGSCIVGGPAGVGSNCVRRTESTPARILTGSGVVAADKDFEAANDGGAAAGGWLAGAENVSWARREVVDSTNAQDASATTCHRITFCFARVSTVKSPQ